MFVPLLADAGRRGRGGAISPRQEDSGALHRQEALTDADWRENTGSQRGQRPMLTERSRARGSNTHSFILHKPI